MDADKFLFLGLMWNIIWDLPVPAPSQVSIIYHLPVRTLSQVSIIYMYNIPVPALNQVSIIYNIPIPALPEVGAFPLHSSSLAIIAPAPYRNVFCDTYYGLSM